MSGEGGPNFLHPQTFSQCEFLDFEIDRFGYGQLNPGEYFSLVLLKLLQMLTLRGFPLYALSWEVHLPSQWLQLTQLVNAKQCKLANTYHRLPSGIATMMMMMLVSTAYPTRDEM